jgi:hypothetical protein
MKNIIISADGGLTPKFKAIIEDRFTENREYWFNFLSSENYTSRETALRKFVDLEKGDNLVTQFTDVTNEYLETFIGCLFVMYRNRRKLNVYVYSPDLRGVLDRYFLSPKNEILDQSLMDVLGFHNVFEIGPNPDKNKLMNSLNDEREEKNTSRVPRGSVPQRQPTLLYVRA